MFSESCYVHVAMLGEFEIVSESDARAWTLSRTLGSCNYRSRIAVNKMARKITPPTMSQIGRFSYCSLGLGLGLRGRRCCGITVEEFRFAVWIGLAFGGIKSRR